MIYYTDLLQCAILLSYEIEGEHLAITSAFAIPQPHAYLDPVQALSHAKSRSHVDLVKLLLASPQKLVGHRDVVVVVDRESHRGVFGPTIDTVYLSDWLYANYFIRGWFLDGIQSGRRVLEVGSGNGLLSSAFAKQGSRYNLKIDAVDVDCRAVDCTYRNIKRNAVAGFDMAQQCCLMVGHFDPNRHLGPFDFVVCNPPYIPEPFGNPRSPGAVPTHGTELLQLMVRAAPTLLADAAEMVMVSSRLSEPELLSAASSVPVVVELVASRRVPFDIQRMEPAHIQWLKQERGLEEVGGDFFHEIGIFRLRRVAIP